eukprot:1064236-Pleurochrysis_carterae.AAC.1
MTRIAPSLRTPVGVRRGVESTPLGDPIEESSQLRTPARDLVDGGIEKAGTMPHDGQITASGGTSSVTNMASHHSRNDDENDNRMDACWKPTLVGPALPIGSDDGDDNVDNDDRICSPLRLVPEMESCKQSTAIKRFIANFRAMPAADMGPSAMGPNDKPSSQRKSLRQCEEEYTEWMREQAKFTPGAGSLRVSARQEGETRIEYLIHSGWSEPAKDPKNTPRHQKPSAPATPALQGAAAASLRRARRMRADTAAKQECTPKSLLRNDRFLETTARQDGRYTKRTSDNVQRKKGEDRETTSKRK